jgi:uncharacterized protein YegJ (DUF2314 family)
MLKHVFAAALTATLAFAQPVLAQDPVTKHETGDPAMDAAIAEAKGSLDRVFAVAMNAEGQVHPAVYLKVAVPVTGGDVEVENIWVNEAVEGASGFSATLANAPVYIDAGLGDQITFAKDSIVDWSVSDNGKLYGNYTTRVQLPQMDAQTRASLSAQLSADPLPDGW